MVYSDFLNFSLSTFSISGSYSVYQIVFRLLLAVTVSQIYLVFDDFDSFRELLVRYFVECSKTGIFKIKLK
jgi:hypothetical protein